MPTALELSLGVFGIALGAGLWLEGRRNPTDV